MRVPCPSCGCPDQHSDMPCGFCAAVVPSPQSDNESEPGGLFAYRGWVCGGGGLLVSPVTSVIWPDAGWKTAECRFKSDAHIWGVPSLIHFADSADPDLVPPVKGCGHPGHGCGFYAARTHSHLVAIRYTCDVIGKVEMAGKIIPAENGFRAQYMRPVELTVPYDKWQLVAGLEKRYGIPVNLGMTVVPDDAPDRCPKCTSRMPKLSITCALCGYTHT